MDNTSIITQVANPKEEESISSSQDKGKRHTHVICTLVFLYYLFIYLFMIVFYWRCSARRGFWAATVKAWERERDRERERERESIDGKPPLFSWSRGTLRARALSQPVNIQCLASGVRWNLFIFYWKTAAYFKCHTFCDVKKKCYFKETNLYGASWVYYRGRVL